MSKIFRSLAAAVLCLLSASIGHTQTLDPAGHWTGAIKGPSGDIPFDVDLVRGVDGAYAGALSMPGEELKGLPLRRVVVSGRSVQFYARTDQQFAGTVSDDGTSIEGELQVPQGSASVSLMRRGPAHIATPVTSARLSDELAGNWSATLSAGEASMHLMLVMENQADDSAVAYLENQDQGGLRIPVRVTKQGTAITVDSPIFNGSFTGVVGADVIRGTYVQGPFSAPLTFKKTR